MYSVTQLQGGYRDLKTLRRRVVRSYGMQRITLDQHNRLLEAINQVEDMITAVREENGDGEADTQTEA